MRHLILTAVVTAALGLAGQPHARAEEPATLTHHVYLHVAPNEDGTPANVVVSLVQDEAAAEGGTAATVVSEPVAPEPAQAAAEIPSAPEPVVEETVEPVEPPTPTDESLPLIEQQDPYPAESVLQEKGIIPGIASIEVPATTVEAAESQSSSTGYLGLLIFVFVLAIFLGFELIAKVPSQLHTPLMSGSNAISGITIVGALVAAGMGHGRFVTLLGTLAVIFAMINVVGGYLVTDRMLGMFKHKEGDRS